MPLNAHFNHLDLPIVFCSSCFACCCLHSLNACLASCSLIRGYLSLVALPSLGSFRNSRAKAPIRNAETSVRLAFSKNTKTKQRPTISRPNTVVLGSRQMRSIITTCARFYLSSNPCATSIRCRQETLQGLKAQELDECNQREALLPLATKT